ncbi:hypothetical protein WG66_012914 [Moniliophthora roreri]|nr:hypothetical protein WG66_012914 [Moniliophthora roreri]KAI3619234.1 hypothetical protein WG66_012914 [Moniliophthora roreri]
MSLQPRFYRDYWDLDLRRNSRKKHRTRERSLGAELYGILVKCIVLSLLTTSRSVLPQTFHRALLSVSATCIQVRGSYALSMVLTSKLWPGTIIVQFWRFGLGMALGTVYMYITVY